MKAETIGQFSNWVLLSYSVVAESSERHSAENKARFKGKLQIFREKLLKNDPYLK